MLFKRRGHVDGHIGVKDRQFGAQLGRYCKLTR